MNETIAFYTNRAATLIRAVISLGISIFGLYIVFTKLMDNTFTTTIFEVVKIGFIVILIMLGIAGISFIIKALDPNPIVVLSPDGISVKTFVFLNNFIPWNEFVNFRQENYKQRVNMIDTGISTSLFRIYQEHGRSVAINLDMLQNGDQFEATLIAFVEQLDDNAGM